MLRVKSPLTDAEEQVVSKVLDCAFAVHRALGPGFRERTYQRALCLELDATALSYECEKSIDLYYRDFRIAAHRLDLIVAGLVLVELKAVPVLLALHDRQVLSYLKQSGLRVGLLLNFNTEKMAQGIRRFVR